MRPERRQPTRLPRPWDSPGKNTGVGCHFLLQCMKVKSESEVVQSCLTLSDPRDCSRPGSSVHGIFQARVLEWGAIAFSIALYYYAFQGTVRLKMFYFFVLLMYLSCEKYYKPITLWCFIADLVPGLTLSDSRRCSQNRTDSCVGTCCTVVKTEVGSHCFPAHHLASHSASGNSKSFSRPTEGLWYCAPP